MKAQSTTSLDREIEVVEHIIGQLKRCLAIYHKAKMHDEFRVTLQDLQTCKIELKKLIAKRTVETNAEQGETIDGTKF